MELKEEVAAEEVVAAVQVATAETFAAGHYCTMERSYCEQASGL